MKIVATAVRRKFEKGSVDKQELKKIYLNYNFIENIDVFMDTAQKIFPKLNCGLASVYLKNLLNCGDVVNGFYKNQGHTFLLINKMVIDITADQFDGPKVYVGHLKHPWSL